MQEVYLRERQVSDETPQLCEGRETNTNTENFGQDGKIHVASFKIF